MKQLLLSEWIRLWKRKTTWIAFLSIPLILIAAAKYLVSQNNVVSTKLPQYTVAWNFPVMGLAEMLITVFQGIIILIVVFSVTEEIRTGQIRMVLLRSYSYTEILFAKYIVIIGVILLFFTVYFIGSHIVGIIFFPMVDKFSLFYHQELATPIVGLMYNVRFYGIACLTAIAIISVMFFIAVVCRTTTAAIGVSIGFIIFTLGYPTMLSYFHELFGNELFVKLYFTSITMIQFEGITRILGESGNEAGWNYSVIAIYISLFTVSTFIAMNKKDYFI
ncbi:ABC transporter permease [Gracilibacillus sp. S3-1-1]|uniref:ABC transporter permease n=1 Tax=Gracilibacillus pellucidus TaxID=3095368 RepID=A0ACC6M0I5_9BACI|nr:ABC transporter permease [Gracilibacillus sp. S3-1-1]MDX8044441.1 ABC transporter permease [Gracilibacillus sp. S3-1-1]